MNKTRLIVLTGLFIALNIIFTRVIKPIDLPFLRVSFSFVSDSFAGIFLGPAFAGISAMLGDILGFALFPPATGSFFPGFTLSAFLSATIYSVILRKNPDSIYRVALSVLLVTLVVDLGLNTLWLSILYNKAWTVFFTARLIKSIILYPIQVAVISLLWRYVGKQLTAIIKRS